MNLVNLEGDQDQEPAQTQPRGWWFMNLAFERLLCSCSLSVCPPEPPPFLAKRSRSPDDHPREIGWAQRLGILLALTHSHTHTRLPSRWLTIARFVRGKRVCQNFSRIISLTTPSHTHSLQDQVFGNECRRLRTSQSCDTTSLTFFQNRKSDENTRRERERERERAMQILERNIINLSIILRGSSFYSFLIYCNPPPPARMVHAALLRPRLSFYAE